MFRSGRLLPGLMSAEGPHSTRSPCLSRAGAMMYRFSPSAKCSSAIREVRLGSYSMCATLAGTPSLSARRKSITRYARLCPPPWCRVVIRPLLLRPPRECSGRTSDFSGSSRVTSTKSATLAPRRPGVVGLYLRMPIRVSPSAHRSAEDLDPVARRQAHDGALGVLAATEPRPGALALALPVQRVDVEDLHTEDLLDGDLDLRLVGVRPDEERVLVLVQQPVALLRDDRGEQDVAGVGDAHSSSSSPSETAGDSVTVPSPAAGEATVSTVPRPSTSDGTGCPGMSSVDRSGSSLCPVRARNASRPARLNTTSSLTSTSYVLSWPASSTCTDGTLRRLLKPAMSSRSSTTSTLRAVVVAVSAASAVFVDGTSPSAKDSTTCTRSALARSESAPRSAAAFIFFGVRWSYLRGVGPCTVPPPANCGARVEPCRARPMPLCRYALLPPPETSPRDLVSCVPRRAAACWATTTWCISAMLACASNTSAGRSTLPAVEPSAVRTSMVGTVIHLPSRRGAGALPRFGPT